MSPTAVKKTTAPPAKKPAATKRVAGTGQPSNRMHTTRQPAGETPTQVAERLLSKRMVPVDPRIVTQISASASTAPTAPEGKIRGYEGQVYYGASTAAEAIFANVVSFDLEVKADSIDASDRATVGWKDKMTGLKEWTGTCKANAIQSGTDLIALFTALTGGTTLTGSFRPQDVTGGIAYFGSFVITSYKHSSPESGLQTLDLSLEGRGALVLGSVTTGGSPTP